MTKEKELSLDEMITLARMVQYWEKVKEVKKGTHVRYTGTVGNILVEVATIYFPASPPKNYSGPNYDWGPGKVTSSMDIYGAGECLGSTCNLMVYKMVDLAKEEYSRRMNMSRDASMKEAKALLRTGKQK